MTELSPSEATFIKRCAPRYAAHIEAGLSPDAALEKAAADVLQRDLQLWCAATAKNEQGEAIREALAKDVYRTVHGTQEAGQTTVPVVKDSLTAADCGQCEGTGMIAGGLSGNGEDEQCPVCDGSGALPATA